MGKLRTEILYEDEDILVCYKPAGIPTQTKNTMQMDVESELRNYMKGKALHVVHRLDQPVEGILVFGKTKEAAAYLASQLSGDEMNKEYYGVVSGVMGQKQGTLVNYLKKEAKGNFSTIVLEKDSEGKYAELSYEVVGEYTVTETGKLQCIKEVINCQNEAEGHEEEIGDILSYKNKRIPKSAGTTGREVSLLRIRLKTGRHHQIRVQLAGANHPLLGDQKYADTFTQELGRQMGVRTVALCAARLYFSHPVKKKKMEFEIKPKGFPFRDIC